MGRKYKFKAQEVADALTETKGMVFIAAKRLGCSYSTVYNYVNRNKSVREAKEAAEGEMLDVSELALWKAVQNGEPWAIQFNLKTKGKNRGYVERQEVTGADGGAIKHSMTVRELTQGGDTD